MNLHFMLSKKERRVLLCFPIQCFYITTYITRYSYTSFNVKINSLTNSIFLDNSISHLMKKDHMNYTLILSILAKGGI